MQSVNLRIYTKSINKQLVALNLSLISINDIKEVTDVEKAAAFENKYNNFFMSPSIALFHTFYKSVQFKDASESRQICTAKIKKIAFIVISIDLYFD